MSSEAPACGLTIAWPEDFDPYTTGDITCTVEYGPFELEAYRVDASRQDAGVPVYATAAIVTDPNDVGLPPDDAGVTWDMPASLPFQLVYASAIRNEPEIDLSLEVLSGDGGVLDTLTVHMVREGNAYVSAKPVLCYEGDLAGGVQEALSSWYDLVDPDEHTDIAVKDDKGREIVRPFAWNAVDLCFYSDHGFADKVWMELVARDQAWEAFVATPAVTTRTWQLPGEWAEKMEYLRGAKYGPWNRGNRPCDVLDLTRNAAQIRKWFDARNKVLKPGREVRKPIVCLLSHGDGEKMWDSTGPVTATDLAKALAKEKLTANEVKYLVISACKSQRMVPTLREAKCHIPVVALRENVTFAGAKIKPWIHFKDVATKDERNLVYREFQGLGVAVRIASCRFPNGLDPEIQDTLVVDLKIGNEPSVLLTLSETGNGTSVFTGNAPGAVSSARISCEGSLTAGNRDRLTLIVDCVREAPDGQTRVGGVRLRVLEDALASNSFDWDEGPNEHLGSLEAWDEAWRQMYLRHSDLVTHAYYDIILSGWRDPPSLKNVQDGYRENPNSPLGVAYTRLWYTIYE